MHFFVKALLGGLFFLFDQIVRELWDNEDCNFIGLNLFLDVIFHEELGLQNYVNFFSLY